MNAADSRSVADLALDANDIIQATASLAAHFERLGLSLAPTPIAGNVQDWTAQFTLDSAAPAATPPAKTSPTATSPATTPPATAPTTSTRRGDSVSGATAPASSSPTNRAQPPTRPSHSAGGGAPVTVATGAYPSPSLPVVERTNRLSELASAVAGCTRCDALAKSRTQTVFGEGNVAPRVVFFGEAPGADEDRSGRPFVGQAGQLLTKMIQACSFAREDVYILNTVKCRPPGNRNPEPQELQHCREYFVAQLEVLQPEYIVCLGAVSSQALLSSTLSIGRLRGKFHQYFQSKVVVTYHPAYLLRNPDAKKAAWDDLQMMLRDMGITPGR